MAGAGIPQNSAASRRTEPRDQDPPQGGIVWRDFEGKARWLARGEPGVFGFADFSPDGRRVAVQYDDGAPRQIWVVDVAGGEPSKLSRADELELSHPQWSPVDPDAILVIVDHENVGRLSVATGDVELLTDFNESTVVVDYASWSPDGEKVFFSLSRKVGDVYLLEGL